MHKSIVVFEIEGGSDEYFDGHRKDIMPVVNAIREAGWSTEVVYYRPEWKGDLHDCVSQNFGGYVSHVNPGSIPGDERGYFELLTGLSVAGLVGISTPGEMMTYSARDTLIKFKDTDLVPSDTAAYYGVKAFHNTFPTSLPYGEHILKQNRGSTGFGIWRVHIAGEEVAKSVELNIPLPLGTELKYTEAVDNHTETHELGEFMDFCDQYIIGNNGMFVDVRFMPRITEGEIRILLVSSRPVFVAHKKPAEGDDAFSTTLFSDVKYTYSKLGEWQDLIGMFAEVRPVIVKDLGGDNTPLIWTADFMPADDEDDEDTYVFGKINCSCVGFTSEPDMDIQKLVAQEAIKRVKTADEQSRQLRKTG